jgi:hypothetical protein
MKQSIQNKINNIIEHSTSKGNVKDMSVKNDFFNEDSLLKAIRSEKDASIFIAELNAVIKVAQSK